MPRKGKWWSPERKTNWLSSAEVTVVTIVDDVRPSKETVRDEDQQNANKFANHVKRNSEKEEGEEETPPIRVTCTDPSLQPEYLDRLTPTKVAMVHSADEHIGTSHTKHKICPKEDWMQKNTTIFKLGSPTFLTDTSSLSSSNNNPNNDTKTTSNSTAEQCSIDRTPTEGDFAKCSYTTMSCDGEKQLVLKNHCFPAGLQPKSYSVSIDAEGKIHMSKPLSKHISSGSKKAKEKLPNGKGIGSGQSITLLPAENVKQTESSIVSHALNVEPTPGENPAPYTVIINQTGTLETVQTSSNHKHQVKKIYKMYICFEGHPYHYKHIDAYSHFHFLTLLGAAKRSDNRPVTAGKMARYRSGNRPGCTAQTTAACNQSSIRTSVQAMGVRKLPR